MQKNQIGFARKRPNPQRYFYHSFARDRHIDPLIVLDSICRNGLLLVPERVEFEDPLHPLAGSTVWLNQQRICFTEQTLMELRNLHSKSFGPFSIEYEPDVIRALGALPVTYIPMFGTGQKGEYYAGGCAMVACITSTLSLLNCLQEHSDPDSALKGVWDWVDQSGVTHTYDPPDEERIAAQKMLTSLERTVGKNFAEMRGALETAASIWYPTDHRDNLLSNYRQREWRIVLLRHFAPPPFISDLNECQKQELRQINHRFFASNLDYPEGPRQRVEDCLYLKDVKNKHVLSLARRLIVPYEQVSDAEAVLAIHGFSLKVHGIHVRN